MSNQTKRMPEAYDEFIVEMYNFLYPLIVTVDKPISISIHKYDKYKLFGHLDPYGNVHIGMATILEKVCSDNMVKNFILESLTHELTHLNQDIDHKITKINKEYAAAIENQCRTQASVFILDNQKLIEEKFNMRIERNMFEQRMVDYNYQVKSLFNAYIMKLEAAYDSAEIMRILRHNHTVILRYKDTEGKVVKHIIKQYNVLNPDIGDFNRALYRSVNNKRRYTTHFMNNIYYIDIF